MKHKMAGSHSPPRLTPASPAPEILGTALENLRFKPRLISLHFSCDGNLLEGPAWLNELCRFFLVD